MNKVKTTHLHFPISHWYFASHSQLFFAKIILMRKPIAGIKKEKHNRLYEYLNVLSPIAHMVMEKFCFIKSGSICPMLHNFRHKLIIFSLICKFFET